MNILEILNFLNPSGLNNTIFYPLLTIFASSFVAFSLSLYDSKNRLIYVFTSISKIVSIICVSANAICQILTICSDDTVFKMFVLFTVTLIFAGFAIDYKVKYIFVSHIISSILHFCFYCYCKNYDAGIISEALHPSFEYLILLAFVYLLLCWPNIKMSFSIRNSLLDRFLPKNESGSHKAIVLLQAYSMIIHTTFMVFMYNSTFDYWAFYVTALFVVLLQLTIVILSLRIMYVYPSCANAPFYVSAYAMIIKTLIDSLYIDYKMFQENTPFNVQSQYFYNTFTYLFVYILIICILSCEVAYAADGPEPSSPVSESNMFNRISQSGLSKLLGYASFYEGMSMFREWLQEQFGLGNEIDEFSTVVENCHNAKTNLESIKFKYSSEVELINEAKYVLKGCDIQPSGLSIETLEEYKNRLEQITIKMNAKYDTYNEYKNNTTDYVARRLWGNNCFEPRR